MKKIYILNPQESYSYKEITETELKKLKEIHNSIEVSRVTSTGVYYVIDF